MSRKSAMSARMGKNSASIPYSMKRTAVGMMLHAQTAVSRFKLVEAFDVGEVFHVLLLSMHILIKYAVTMRAFNCPHFLNFLRSRCLI